MSGLARGMEECHVAHLVARMALRLHDQALLERAVSFHQRVRRPGGLALKAIAGSVDGLLSGDAGMTVEVAAARLEDLQYIRRSLDAWTDAALLAARAGRRSRSYERAVAITQRTGMHPLLGLLPEARWI